MAFPETQVLPKFEVCFLYIGRNDLGNVEKQINPCLSINQQCKYSKIDEYDPEDDEEEDNLEDSCSPPSQQSVIKKIIYQLQTDYDTSPTF